MSSLRSAKLETLAQRRKKRSGPVEVNGIKLVKSSHNVYSKRYKAVSLRTPGKKRKPKSMNLSHSQIFSLCSMLLCNDRDRLHFLMICKESYRGKQGAIPAGCPSDCTSAGGVDFGEDTISKTPIWFIDHCLRKTSSTSKSMPQGFSPTVLPSSIQELGKAFNDAYLIEGILNTHSSVDMGLFNQHNRVVQHVKSCHNKNSNIPEVILYLPSAGIFYSRYAPAVVSSSNLSPGVSSTYYPLDASWLRIRRHDGQVAKGGFLSTVSRVHRIMMSPPPTAVFHCHHVPDTAIPLPPDLVKQKVEGSWMTTVLHNYRDRQEAYASALLLSSTNKALSKRTAVGYLYKNPESAIGNSPLIIDPKQGEVCLRVLTKLSNMNHINSQHTVRIKYIEPRGEYEPLFTASSNLISHIPTGTTAGSIRAAEREYSNGNMVAYGEHIFNSHKICEYAATQKYAAYLRPFMVEYRKVLSREFPLETSTMLSYLRSFGEFPPESMGGKDGVTKSVNISIDLGNAAHFDTNDLGTGVAFWVMSNPSGSASNWTYLMPNLIGRRIDGTTFRGVIVKLCHGTLISWNGADIRHCTGVPHSVSEGNHLYGMHVTNNHNSLSLYPRVRAADA